MLYFLEDIDERIENAKIGLKRFPESSLLNNMMGYLMMEKGDLESARNHINIYMTAHPDEPNAYDQWVIFYLLQEILFRQKKCF